MFYVANHNGDRPAPGCNAACAPRHPTRATHAPQLERDQIARVHLQPHQKLDAAVDKVYQLCGGTKSYASDAERVAFLFARYQRLTSLLPAAKSSKTRKAAKPRGADSEQAAKGAA